MQLDSRTVYAASTGSLLVTAAIVAFASRSYPDELLRVGRRWALAVAVSALGFAFIVVRGAIPDAGSILGGHATAVAGAALFADACALFVHRPQRRAWTWAPVAAALASASCFYFVRPNYALRMTVFSSLMALVLARCAVILVRGRPTDLRSTRFVAIGFAGAATLMGMRAVVSLRLDPRTAPTAIFSPGAFEQVAIVGIFLCYFALSFGFVVICNERFNLDLQRLAAFDPLTDLYNRRTIEDLARHEVARARRSGTPLLLALIDVDRFKEVNDERGHLTGDAALRAVAALLQRTLRAQDLLARYGGDEFLVLMPATELAAGAAACERLREALRDVPLLDTATAPAPLRLTLSIGLAAAAGPEADLASLLHAADDALYEAKRRGRDRVCTRQVPALAEMLPALA